LDWLFTHKIDHRILWKVAHEQIGTSMASFLRVLFIIWIARYAVTVLLIITLVWLLHFLNRHL